MATTDEVQQRQRAIEAAEKANPLLVLSLGDLVREMYVLSTQDPNVILPKDQVPSSSADNYARYDAVILELNRREREYTAYRAPPR